MISFNLILLVHLIALTLNNSYTQTWGQFNSEIDKFGIGTEVCYQKTGID